jgi:hypothetical protein
MVMRVDGLDAACVAACHLGRFERSIELGREMLELAARADVRAAVQSTGSCSDGGVGGADGDRSPRSRYLDHISTLRVVLGSFVEAIAEFDPQEWRRSLARGALTVVDGRFPGEQSPYLSLFAHWAIEDGEFDRARHLNDLVNLRPACFSMKRANQIRLDGLPPELLHDEAHHRQMMLQELESRSDRCATRPSDGQKSCPRAEAAPGDATRRGHVDSVDALRCSGLTLAGLRGPSNGLPPRHSAASRS